MVKRKPSECPDGAGRDPRADTEETYVFRRAEDRSKWMHLSYLFDKYRPLVWFAFLFLVAAGFGFQTPKQALDEVSATHHRADTIVNRRVDSLHVRIQNLERLALSVEALVRLRCIDTESDLRAMRAAGINCEAWLNNRPLSVPQR